MCVAKTKAQLISVFVYAYAKSRFSHDAANIVVKHTGDYALVISAAVLGQALFFSDGGCTKFFPVKSVKLVHFLMLSLGT